AATGRFLMRIGKRGLLAASVATLTLGPIAALPIVLPTGSAATPAGAMVLSDPTNSVIWQSPISRLTSGIAGNALEANDMRTRIWTWAPSFFGGFFPLTVANPPVVKTNRGYMITWAAQPSYLTGFGIFSTTLQSVN